MVDGAELLVALPDHFHAADRSQSDVWRRWISKAGGR